MTFEFEYPSEFEFIFENILGYETGSQMGWLMKKSCGRKYCASVPLKEMSQRLGKL